MKCTVFDLPFIQILQTLSAESWKCFQISFKKIIRIFTLWCQKGLCGWPSTIIAAIWHEAFMFSLGPNFNSLSLQTTHQNQFYFSKNISMEFTQISANMCDIPLTKESKNLVRKDIQNPLSLHAGLHGIPDLLPTVQHCKGQLWFW